MNRLKINNKAIDRVVLAERERFQKLKIYCNTERISYFFNYDEISNDTVKSSQEERKLIKGRKGLLSIF